MSPPTNYSRGADLEREVARVLEKEGYSTVRGAGSKGEFTIPGQDSPMKVDLVASKQGKNMEKELWIVLIQCKSKKKKR